MTVDDVKEKREKIAYLSAFIDELTAVLYCYAFAWQATENEQTKANKNLLFQLVKDTNLEDLIDSINGAKLALSEASTEYMSAEEAPFYSLQTIRNHTVYLLTIKDSKMTEQGPGKYLLTNFYDLKSISAGAENIIDHKPEVIDVSKELIITPKRYFIAKGIKFFIEFEIMTSDLEYKTHYLVQEEFAEGKGTSYAEFCDKATFDSKSESVPKDAWKKVE